MEEECDLIICAYYSPEHLCVRGLFLYIKFITERLVYTVENTNVSTAAKEYDDTQKIEEVMIENANEKFGNYKGGEKKRSMVPVRFVTVTGILSAIAFVLQLIELPVPFMPWFIKFDFSDLPALVGALSLGPVYGVIIEFIKNLLHTLDSGSFGVGELSNFMLGAVFTGVAGLIYKFKKNKKGAIIGTIVGALAMAAFSLPSNIYVVYPVYYTFLPKENVLAAYQAIIPSMKSVEESILLFNVPFTFVKGMIDVLITFLIYKHISPILKGDDER